VFIYLFFVETKGRTLEELDEIFKSPDPRRASTARTKHVKRVIQQEPGKREFKDEVV
jgi:hypothetical protein